MATCHPPGPFHSLSRGCSSLFLSIVFDVMDWSVACFDAHRRLPKFICSSRPPCIPLLTFLTILPARVGSWQPQRPCLLVPCFSSLRGLHWCPAVDYPQGEDASDGHCLIHTKEQSIVSYYRDCHCHHVGFVMELALSAKLNVLTQNKQFSGVVKVEDPFKSGHCCCCICFLSG